MLLFDICNFLHRPTYLYGRNWEISFMDTEVRQLLEVALNRELFGEAYFFANHTGTML